MEVCPEAGVIIQELSQRIALAGGAALIADYGHEGTKTDTFRVRMTPEHDFPSVRWYHLRSEHLKLTEDLYLCFLWCLAL